MRTFKVAQVAFFCARRYLQRTFSYASRKNPSPFFRDLVIPYAMFSWKSFLHLSGALEEETTHFEFGAESQIVAAIKTQEASISVKEIYREMGISESDKGETAN